MTIDWVGADSQTRNAATGSPVSIIKWGARFYVRLPSPFGIDQPLRSTAPTPGSHVGVKKNIKIITKTENGGNVGNSGVVAGFFLLWFFVVFFCPPPSVLSGLRAGPHRDTSAAAAGESAIVGEGRGAEGRLPGRCLRGKEGRKHQKLNDEYGAELCMETPRNRYSGLLDMRY